MENEPKPKEKVTPHIGTVTQFQAVEKAGTLEIRREKPVNQASDFWLPREEVEKVIAAAGSLRDRSMISLLYYCMLRRNELRNLRIEDVDFVRGRLNLRITKRSKPRTVPAPGRIIGDVRLLVGNRGAGFIFLSQKGQRLSNKQVNLIVAKTARLAGITNPDPRKKHLNPHLLRHSMARWLRRQEPPIPIEVLQKLLGHSSVKTTLDIYGSADVEFVEREYHRLVL